VRCHITAEVFYVLAVSVTGLMGLAYRIIGFARSFELLVFFTEDAQWPPPYMPSLGLLSELNAIAAYFFAWGLLACTLRLTLYYSIISKGLYVIRLTLSRALYRLIPSLFFVIATMIAFAITGNLLYYHRERGFRSPQAALQTVMHLLRKPTQFEGQMTRLTARIPSDEIDVSRLFFVFGFTLTTIWVMSNLYKAAVIAEFSNVILMFRNRAPADLKDDPWPPFSPFVIAKQQNERWREQRHLKYVTKGKQREWRMGVEKQMALQKQFRDRLNQAQQQNSHEALAPGAAKDATEQETIATAPDLGRLVRRLRLDTRRALRRNRTVGD